MGNLQDKIYLGFNKGITLESLRQWVVLLTLVGLVILYSLNTYQLFKLFQKINFEVIIMISSIIRLLLYFLHEFIFPDIFIVFICLYLHTVIMMVVFYMFSNVVFKLSERPDLRKKFLYPYIVVISILLLANIIHSLSHGEALSCNTHSFSAHWYVIHSIDLLCAISNAIMGAFLVKNLKKQEVIYSSISSMSDLLHKNEFQTIKLQMRILMWSSLIFSCVEIVWVIIGGNAISGHLECVAHRFWNPTNSVGALYLFVRSLILIGPTIALWTVFFVAPLYQGRMPKLLDSKTVAPDKINIDEEYHEEYDGDLRESSAIYTENTDPSNGDEFEERFEKYARLGSSVKNDPQFTTSDVLKTTNDPRPRRSTRGSM